MGSLYLTSMADWLRAAGVKVVEYDGWKTRARSSGGYDSGRPWGVMWHHTASSTSPQNDASYMCNGSSDRPIANLLIARDGTAWVLAAGATNTNGKGGPWKWSKGTVSADSMNLAAVGMELANAGTGESFPQVQVDCAFATSIAIIKALKLADSDICQHYQYAPTRKIDPAKAGSVQGPWQPGTCTSSGTWDLNDTIAEHCKRYGGAPAPTPPAPRYIPEEDDVPGYLVVSSDPKVTPVFAVGVTSCRFVPNATVRDNGYAAGLYTKCPGQGDGYYRASTNDIQGLINQFWSGGPVPAPYKAPSG